jgi:CRISPR-associated protein Csd1
LRRPVEVRTEETVYDLETLLGTPLGDGRDREGPPAELSQLQATLALPWTGTARVLNVADNGFYLAVLSANKGRLVVREWFNVDLVRLRQNLAAFLGALRIENPWGTEDVSPPIPAILGVLKATDPDLTRGLLRTAYLGHRPPEVCSRVRSGVFGYRRP